MEKLSNHPKKKGWQKLSQQIKSFFKSNPLDRIEGEEIDYYHQYVFPQKIKTMKQARYNSSRSPIISKRKQHEIKY